MRKCGFLLCAVVACALLLLGWSGLVQGPEGETEAQTARIPEHAAMVCAEPVRSDTTSLPLQSRAEALRIGITARQEQAAVYVPAVSCDRNGQPMTSTTWWRTVYASCAPESDPG